jgi:hypothetical protein
MRLNMCYESNRIEQFYVSNSVFNSRLSVFVSRIIYHPTINVIAFHSWTSAFLQVYKLVPYGSY